MSPPRRLAQALLLLALAGCMERTKPTPLPRTPSLYTRLGGEPGITAIIDDLFANVVLSNKISETHKRHFLEGDVAGLKRKLIEQIAAATGGPQTYTGRDMKTAHAGMGITDAEFDGMVEALQAALKKNQVKDVDQKDLLALLGPMKPDIVESH
jgi:hemoglobin